MIWVNLLPKFILLNITGLLLDLYYASCCSDTLSQHASNCLLLSMRPSSGSLNGVVSYQSILHCMTWTRIPHWGVMREHKIPQRHYSYNWLQILHTETDLWIMNVEFWKNINPNSWRKPYNTAWFCHFSFYIYLGSRYGWTGIVSNCPSSKPHAEITAHLLS